MIGIASSCRIHRSVVLGFIRTQAELRALKKTPVRSNTLGVYRSDQDGGWITGHGEIQELALAIEKRRIEPGKTSGFERLYPRVTKLCFGGMARHLAELRPMLLIETKILDATPGIIGRYALDDEQSLLAKIRYNRLIDIFTGLTCYSLQSHLRTTVPGLGQVETDEIYIGVDKRGAHYVIPVQAKGSSDRLGIVQIEQDFAICAAKFAGLIWLPVAAQFIANDLIALFSFEQSDKGIAVSAEKHYRLTAPDGLSAEELAACRARPW